MTANFPSVPGIGNGGGAGTGQVDSVVSGTNITVDSVDPVNPIVNLDAAVTGTSVNGVTLDDTGAASSFLNQTGAYSVPGGTGTTDWVGLTDTPVSITANLIVQGNSAGTDLEFGQNLNTTASPTFDDLTLTGSVTVENGSVAAPSVNFASHLTSGLSVDGTGGLELSVNGIEGLGIRTSTTPANGLLIEMSDTGDAVNVVPVGSDAAVALVVRGRGGDALNLQTVSGDVNIGAGTVMTISPTGTAVVISGDVTASNFNGVAITTGGSASNFLDETGAYSVPPDTGQVDSVVSGTNITIDASDPVNPIANLDAAITGTSVNGVSLTTGGATTNFLNESGSYSAPLDAGGNVTTSVTLPAGRVVVGNGTEDIDVATASFNGNDLNVVGALTVENGAAVAPSINFASHTSSGLFTNITGVGIAVDGVEGLGIRTSSTPVNGLLVEMANTGGDVNIVPEGTDSGIALHVRAKGGDLKLNQLAGNTFIGISNQIRAQSNGFTSIGRGVGVASHYLELASDGTGDTIPIARISSTGTDSAGYRTFVGNRDGNTHITGFPGDLHHINNGELSGLNISLAAISSTLWHSASFNPPEIRVINNTAQYEDLFSGGTLTVTTDTLLIFNMKPVSTSVFSINTGVALAFIGRYKGDVGVNYSGAGTLISGEGSFTAAQECELESVGTGTLFDMTGATGTVIMKEVTLEGWDDVGEIANGGLIINTVEADNITVGLTLTNPREVAVTKVFQDGVAMAGSLFTFNTRVIGELYSFKDIRGNLTATGSIFDFNPDIPTTTQIAVSECLTTTGNIFKQTQVATDAFTLVSGSAVSSQAITAVQDNGSGLTEFLSTALLFEGEEITISGFTINTAYNVTIKVFDVVINTSFVANIPFGSTESGVWASKRILCFSSGNSFSNGDTAEITDSQFYNGFYRVLDSTTNEVEVNHSFEGTDTGTLSRDVGLDERDPRIKAFSNFSDNADSKALIFAERNGNNVTTSISSNATTYSTCQLNVTNSQVTENFRMISAQISSYIYTGIETITVPVVATFTIIRSGSSGNVRVAVTKNDVDPTSDTVGYEPMVVNTTPSKGTFEAEITVSTGDEIVPKVVGDGISGDITITDFRMIVG